MQTNQYVMNKLELEEGSWSSLYVRVLPTDLVVDGVLINNEETLKDLIENKLNLGKVERIDFSERKNHKGMTNRSAYIHFFMWDNMAGSNMRDMIENYGSARVCGYYNSEGQYQAFMGQWHNGASFNRFIEFKKNLNPVSKTTNEEMNKDQLISKCNHYETRVKELFNKVNNFIDGERKMLISLIQTNKNNEHTKMEVEEKYHEGQRVTHVSELEDTRMTLEELDVEDTGMDVEK